MLNLHLSCIILHIHYYVMLSKYFYIYEHKLLALRPIYRVKSQMELIITYRNKKKKIIILAHRRGSPSGHQILRDQLIKPDGNSGKTVEF